MRLRVSVAHLPADVDVEGVLRIKGEATACTYLPWSGACYGQQLFSPLPGGIRLVLGSHQHGEKDLLQAALQQAICDPLPVAASAVLHSSCALVAHALPGGTGQPYWLAAQPPLSLLLAGK